MTSNAVLQRVKYAFQARKAGHTGSLDPLATGLLPICLGTATKISQFLLDADKHYQVHCTLGVRTTTYDSEGEVSARAEVPEISDESVNHLLASFIGDQLQIPPMHSALHHQGQRLYKLAQKGIEVERKPRPVRISQLSLLARNGDEWVMQVHCSKGTYIRSLIDDLGQKLGCGAHVSELRRTGVGPFLTQSMVTADYLTEQQELGFDVLDKLLLPVDAALQHIPKVSLDSDATKKMLHGNPICCELTPGRYRIYSDNQQFMGIGDIATDQWLRVVRLILSE